MRKLSLLCVVCLAIVAAKPASAGTQNTDSAQSTDAASAPTQVQTPDQVPNRPAYRGKKPSPAHPKASTATPAAPVPTPAPAPVVPPQPQPAAVTAAPMQTQQTTPATTPQQHPTFEARNPYGPTSPVQVDDEYGSAYIPLDSWMYPALLRLYSMGYLNTAYIGMRPWTRRSVYHMLEASSQSILDGGNDQAIDIYTEVLHELQEEVTSVTGLRGNIYGVQSVYTRILGIGGQPLRDSFHVGSTIVNDYGRPYAEGFNNVTGFSTLNESGRFSLYVRGEYQHAPATTGYSLAQAETLSNIDQIYPYVPQSTIPAGPIAAQNPFRILEANLSAHVAGHEISFGKSDAWFGPGYGGAMAWSNNAENIYSFRINRVEPLHIPLLSRVLGPIRYDFFVGSLKGHTHPNAPWVHAEKFSFKPTPNFEFGFERTAIWGGLGHAPITLHTFLNSFFSISDTNVASKYSRNDPGARFSAFDFTYRLPYLRNWLTFYTDSEVHDDVTPVSAPRRAAYRPGLYLSHVPGVPKLDFRVEAVTTDPPVGPSRNGSFMYWETIQRQGYTNKGQLMGDWIGREGKGGQAWLTYHLASNQWLQFAYRNNKTAKDFIPGGTTQNQFTVYALFRIHKDIEVNGWIQYERWKAPFVKPGLQSDTSTALQITWYPKLHTR
ncbi:MAG: capsule assembly Wzi family protein [Acidobacteriaceae bacterium]